jgi:hypothetical protein
MGQIWFEREAWAIAALNHTNVCILHDIGQNYLVMELVEGPTLAERLAQGPIPLEEALRGGRADFVFLDGRVFLREHDGDEYEERGAAEGAVPASRARHRRVPSKPDGIGGELQY